MFTIENQGTNSYLVYTLKADEQLDTLSLGMLSNNKISGFAPVLYTQLDEEKYLKYAITSKISLKQLFSSIISRDRLLTILANIIDALIVSDDYMLMLGSIVLDISSIYVDVSSYNVALICLPIMDKEVFDKDVKTFFKQILFNLQIDQNENTDYFSKIISYLNMEGDLLLSDFKLFLLSFRADAPVAMGMSGVLNPIQMAAAQTAATQVKAAHPDANPTVVGAQQKQETSRTVPQAQMDTTKTVNAKHISDSEQLRKIQIQSTTQNSGNADRISTTDVESQTEPLEKKKSFFSLFGHKDKKKETEMTDVQPKEKKGKEKKIKEKKAVNGMGIAIPGMPEPAQSIMEVPVPKKEVQRMEANISQSQSLQPSSMPQQFAGENREYARPQVNFGETTVLNAGGAKAGETTVLSDLSYNNSQPYIVRLRNNEKIYINKPVFRIGKERNYVDYFIPDNTAVSRSHANIINKNGSYYLEDTNSTNHTYVNGTIISSGVQTPIKHGDKLMFANEEYEFRLN